MRAAASTLLACAVLAGCSQNMDDQPSYREYKPAPLFRDGRVPQPPVAGTVARGDLARDEEASRKPPLTAALLARGRERFDIFCSPCHGRTGDGDGMVPTHGFPRPPRFDADRVRAATDEHIFDVITNGHGVMYSYAARVPPADRWAIIAYIRALQLSEHASLDEVPPEERGRLAAEPPK